MSGKNSSMREALIAAGVMPRNRKPKFTSFRDYFAGTDIAAELATCGMPESKMVRFEDFSSSEQVIDFLNLTRNRLYRANSNNTLKDNYISLLESTMLRHNVPLPAHNKPVNVEATNEIIADQSSR